MSGQSLVRAQSAIRSEVMAWWPVRNCCGRGLCGCRIDYSSHLGICAAEMNRFSEGNKSCYLDTYVMQTSHFPSLVISFLFGQGQGTWIAQWNDSLVSSLCCETWTRDEKTLLPFCNWPIVVSLVGGTGPVPLCSRCRCWWWHGGRWHGVWRRWSLHLEGPM